MTDIKLYEVEDVFQPNLAKIIYKEIMDSRKCVGDDQFEYAVLEKVSGDKTYIITARHVSLGEVVIYGKSNCNDCYGTGRKMMIIDKGQIKNPNDFMMLASTSLKGLTPEQQKIVIEKEKASKTWKVLLPCHCAIKNMIKKGRQILSNDLKNVVIEIACIEKV